MRYYKEEKTRENGLLVRESKEEAGNYRCEATKENKYCHTVLCTTKTDDDRLFLAQAECGVLGLCRPSSPSCLTSQLAPPAQDPASLGSLLDWPLAFFLPSLLDFTS